MRGAELASPSVSAACSPPEVVTGLCSVHDVETYSAHSPMVSTHLGAHENKQQMEGKHWGHTELLGIFKALGNWIRVYS